MSVLCLFTHVLCVRVLRPLSGIFCLFVGQDLFFFGEDKLATLSKKQTLSFIVCRCRQGVRFRFKIRD